MRRRREKPAPPPGPGPERSGELLTVSFAAPEARVYGQGRLERDRADGVARSLVAVFSESRTLTTGRAEAELDSDPAAQALTLQSLGPDRWTARYSGGDGQEGAFRLELEGLGAVNGLSADDGATDSVGDALLRRCRMTGTVTVSGREISLDGLGQVTLMRESADDSGASLVRDLDAWFGERLALAVHAVRPAGARGHGEERTYAAVVDGEPPSTTAIEEARLSTGYDASGSPRRAGLELWPTEDSEFPRRATGEALCGATVLTDAGGRWDCAFLEWRMQGERGLGPYSIMRRAPSTGRRS